VPTIELLTASAYTVPTDRPESDGTLAWDSTTIVVVEVAAGGKTGIGYTYTDAAAAGLISDTLAGTLTGAEAMDVGARGLDLYRATRNLGRPGIVATAISAVDIALWDLKARLLDQPLVALLTGYHDACPIYGMDSLADQLGGWAASGIPRVKLKVGRNQDRDPARMDAARQAVGPDVELYVDGNGAYSRKTALHWAARFRDEWQVSWFEEPVTSDDLAGLRLVRDQGPAGLDIAAGEYGYTPEYFAAMIDVVDCLQADVTRCGGITGLLAVGALTAVHDLDLSVHCAPQVSAQAACGVPRLRHLEYFHDHVRIEALAFDGRLEPDKDGTLRPDRTRVGHGLTVKAADLDQYRVR
jgi:L-alanine-DL-glutamate epimerase-like enolase superfamily enzyme